MIKDQKPLTYAEVSELVGDSERAKKVRGLIKEFYSLKPNEAKKLKEELTALNFIRLKEEHIVNIVNFLPKDATELIKVLQDVSLEQDEINKILEILKNY